MMTNPRRAWVGNAPGALSAPLPGTRPATTALRWIRTLTDLGVFVRVADPTDGRRVFIELSETAATLVLKLLGEAKTEGVAMV